ncbi:ALP1-like protein [Tanacetum coccineum]
MDRSTFGRLCEMVRDVSGLKGNTNMTLEEIVYLFLYVLAHHKKNRTISLLFLRSGETISRQFNRFLLAILKLHDVLLQKPQPITEDCEDTRWKSFKGCLGALDVTSIRVTPPSDQKPRYRTRKGDIATNVLGVCCPNMQFIYVLPGWEGSAHDGRVLRDAISSPDGLKIPQEIDTTCESISVPLTSAMSVHGLACSQFEVNLRSWRAKTTSEYTTNSFSESILWFQLMTNQMWTWFLWKKIFSVQALNMCKVMFRIVCHAIGITCFALLQDYVSLFVIAY